MTPLQDACSKAIEELKVGNVNSAYERLRTALAQHTDTVDALRSQVEYLSKIVEDHALAPQAQPAPQPAYARPPWRTRQESEGMMEWLPIGPVGWFKYDKISQCWHPQHEEYAATHAKKEGWRQLFNHPTPTDVTELVELCEWRDKVFNAHPNIDLDIEALSEGAK
jgi:hypothetical protein